VAKASIRSPVDGIVLSRQIEPGQTVAASLQAPVLFTIAQNLAQMKVEVDIDEAEVGQVHEGQRATFTVDAWPDREYQAAVQRVALGAQSKEGVVSYQTVLTFDNADLSLRPGMTATAEIITTAKSNVLLVPNAALRFTPAASTQSRGVVGALMPRPPGGGRDRNPQRGERVWVLRDGAPVEVPVRTGATNGQLTELTADAIQPGTQVITDASGSSP
jgi:HlyD family secretion protein